MTIIEKLVILVLLNVGFLVVLLWRLVNAGNSHLKALEASWNIIIFNIKPKTLVNTERIIHWFSLLHKSWWFMIFCSLFIWVLIPNKMSWIVLLIIIIFHIGWFLSCRLKAEEEYNHSIILNNNWGIIFEEIKKDSWFSTKTLAELDLRKKNLLVLAIIRKNQVIAFPKGLEALNIGDRMVLFGDLNYFQSLDG